LLADFAIDGVICKWPVGANILEFVPAFQI